jgi:hypothetical protein
LDERPWYSGFFDHDYLRVFGPVLPEEWTLAEVARVLAPGGRFLLEVANRDTLTELAAMLDRAGLELLAVSGDLDGGPLELDSSFVVALSGRAGKGIS